MKSNQETFSLLIVFIATLPYIHDLIPVGYLPDFFGFSDLRVFLYIVLNHVFALIGWILAYHLARKKNWRFVLWLPIMTTTYEIILKILNLRSTGLNEINVKFALTILLFTSLVVWYFKKKSSHKNVPMDQRDKSSKRE
jgi:ABC-type uncharacterized transport system permease subunit